MPLYEYRCKKCGHEFEKIQKFSDAPIKKCPKCGKKAVEKLLSQSAIQFKGSGWYVTDYAAKSAPKDTSKEEAKPETKPEGASTEAKPKTETKEAPAKKEEKKAKKSKD